MQVIKFLVQYIVAIVGISFSAGVMGFTVGVAAGAVYYAFKLAFNFWSNL